jgi:hypothetical protein
MESLLLHLESKRAEVPIPLPWLSYERVKTFWYEKESFLLPIFSARYAGRDPAGSLPTERKKVTEETRTLLNSPER